MFAKLKAFVARAVRSSEVRHDVSLFATFLVATGVFDRGAPLTLSALASAIAVAARRVVAQRIKTLRARKA